MQVSSNILRTPQDFSNKAKRILDNKAHLFLGYIPHGADQTGFAMFVVIMLMVWLAATAILCAQQIRLLDQQGTTPAYVGASLVWAAVIILSNDRYVRKKIRSLEQQKLVSNTVKECAMILFPDSKAKTLEDLRKASGFNKVPLAYGIVTLLLFNIAIALSYWTSTPTVVIAITVIIMACMKYIGKAVVHLLLLLAYYDEEDAKLNRVFREWDNFGNWVYEKQFPLLSPERLVEVYPEYLEWKKVQQEKAEQE